ncbi:unnamed protein product [Adineta steineri]|uniref:Uncharacterized protein n=1 Tax=Adineta steineri TaxID=433720 RepID=A0A814IFU8_9BILA|nr:unnamed protein product [Adineta steineri]CAF4208566.1 unnamed protein product [Adineta steineri]
MVKRYLFLVYQSTKSCWFLGTIDHIHKGLIPANYVQPLRTKTSSNTTFQSQTPYNVNSDISSPNTNISQSTIQGGTSNSLLI